MENVVNSEYFKLAVVLKSVLGITHHEMKDIRENISKYKKRKLESIRKLERTNENLERIGDIVSNLANYYKLVYDEKGKFSNEAIDDLNKMYKLALEMVQDALDIYEHDNANKLLSSLNKKEQERMVQFLHVTNLEQWMQRIILMNLLIHN